MRSRIDFLKGATVSDSDVKTDLADSTNTNAKRLADEPIPVGSHKRRRIVNSESSSDDEPQDVEQQNVATADPAVVVETSSTAASTSRKRFAILDSSSDSE